jgi:excisionase family DNA binding protein
MPPQLPGPDDELLRPREVAALLGVRTATIARWARQGRLSPLLTPGGHRRYTRAGVRAVLDEEPDAPAMAEDAARLYEQGWSIRQVAQRFGCEYGVMRRMLRRQVTLRTRGGRERAMP